MSDTLISFGIIGLIMGFFLGHLLGQSETLNPEHYLSAVLLTISIYSILFGVVCRMVGF